MSQSYSPSTYIAMDRRQAMAHGASLPDRTTGAALFADISGFTLLTETLANDLGPKRGIEELTRYLNDIYSGLIEKVHGYGGSVIGFSGDAVTCWFDKDDGLRATSVALAMQTVMRQFASVTTPSGVKIPLAIKVSVAAGPVRRFQVGNEQTRLIDVIAGATLVRLATAEHLANRNEVLIDSVIVNRLAHWLTISEWRQDPDSPERFAVISDMTWDAAMSPWPELKAEALSDEQVRPWLLPGILEREKAGREHFLAELRPAVSLFMRFSGIDYDGDENAAQKLDDFVCRVQQIVTGLDGSLVQLTMGDKGSYLYAAFGAPVAHEDDATRACLAALQLRLLSSEFSYIHGLQIGISQGRMRVGPYGSPTCRTYGVLGDHANLAARLMQNAGVNEVLASESLEKSAPNFAWGSKRALQVKGKTEPVTVYSLSGPHEVRHSNLQASLYELPMVGREKELALAESKLDVALSGQGQIIGITAGAGLGKSRLIAEITRLAQARGMSVFIGECQSYGMNTRYLPWRTIWQSFFNVDPTLPAESLLPGLAAQLANIDASLVDRLPLLEAVLNMPIPENDFVRSLDAKVRKLSLEALLVDCVRARAQTQPLVFVIEDCHWLDPLSHDLLEVIARGCTELPVLILIAYRPSESEPLNTPRVMSLPQSSEIVLSEFQPADAARLIALKLAQLGESGTVLNSAVVDKIVERAQGNPFFLEELLNYLRDRGFNSESVMHVDDVDLPSSIHSLVLSRIDQLADSQKATLKTASVVGRKFIPAWLWGLDPQIGESTKIRTDLEMLTRQEFTQVDQPLPEISYLFKHIVTREVAYDSLPFATRAALHGQLAHYLELTYPDHLDQYLDLLAYHYSLSRDTEKTREYLLRAGQSAQAAYANQTAIDYYRRLIELLDEAARAPVQLQLGRVLELVGEWREAGDLYRQTLQIAERDAMPNIRAACEIALGQLVRKQGALDEAIMWLERAALSFDEIDDHVGVCRVQAELGDVYRIKGDYAAAQRRYESSLKLADAITARTDRLTARASVLKSAGTLANQQGDPDRARVLYEEALAIRRELKDKHTIAGLLNNLGMVAMFQEAYATSQPLFAESLATLRDIGDRWSIGQLLNNLGLVTRYQGDFATARQLLEESVAIRRALGDKWGIANSLSSLTNLLIHEGQLEGVRAMLEESLRLNYELGDGTAIAYCLEDFASLAALTQQPMRALRLAGASAAVRASIGSPLPTGEQTAFDLTLVVARQALSEAAQNEALHAGAALTLEQVVDEALNG